MLRRSTPEGLPEDPIVTLEITEGGPAVLLCSHPHRQVVIVKALNFALYFKPLIFFRKLKETQEVYLQMALQPTK